MADLNDSHRAMLRRHRPAMVRFASCSVLPAVRLAFVVAHVRSTLARAMAQSAVIVTDRSSVVLPVSVGCLPKLGEIGVIPELEQLAAQHGAMPVLLVDEHDCGALSFEKLAAIALQNRLIISPAGRDRH